MAREVFGNRFVFIAAGIGMAVGAGNIWRFPRVVAEYGGGTFLLILVLANLVWAIPLLTAESLMGSKARLGDIGAIRDFMGRRFAWIGAWVAVVTLGILFYYTVVSGWGIRYFVYSITGEVSPGVDSQALWDGFISSPAQTIFFEAVAIALTVLIVYRGLKGGIEAVLQVAIPLLFAVLIVLTIRAVTLPGAVEGLRYLFVPDWGAFGSSEIWLQAFTQMAFSTGAGWGLLLTYAVYTREREDITLNCGALVTGNLLASLFAGTTVLCTIYALRGQDFAADALGAGNQGLAFIYLVELLAEMPGGIVFSSLFFFAFTLATVSTLISFFELGIMNLVNMGLSRPKAVLGLGGVAFVLGIPSAYSVNFLNNQDFVWGIGLLVSGALIALVAMRYGLERARGEINGVSDIKVGRWWTVSLALVPVMFLVMFAWWIWQTITVFAPDTWWNPFEVFSTATLVVQWAILFAILYALNNFFARKTQSGPMTKPERPPSDVGEMGSETTSP
ncbi:MAG: sodium-dependent transporter [Rubrobacteraceae bacterium]